jgi:ankyrin repeat protein
MGQLIEAVIDAIQSDNIQGVASLLDGAYKDSHLINEETNTNGYFALHLAAYYGNVELIQLLLCNKNIKVDQPLKEGRRTSLFIAAQQGHEKAVTLLLQKGAGVDEPEESGATPLFIAAANGYVNIIHILLQYKADINQVENQGWTPLYIAAEENRVKVINALWRDGAEIDKPNNDGMTPLYVAIRECNYEVIKFLLMAGASLEHKMKQEKTALDIVKEISFEHSKRKILEIIEEHLNQQEDNSLIQAFSRLKISSQLYENVYNEDLSPTWKTKLEEAQEFYSKGKIFNLFYEGRNSEKTITYFLQAKSKYTEIVCDEQTDKNFKTKAQKRLVNMESPHGKYCPEKLKEIIKQN